MSNGTLQDLEDRIAIARDNIRQLIEQAAAYSGAEDEDRNAERLAQQNAELGRLMKERDALVRQTKTAARAADKPKARRRAAARMKTKPKKTTNKSRKKSVRKTSKKAVAKKGKKTKKRK